MRASFLTAIAALAASSAAAPLEAREVYATWSATDVHTQVSHFVYGTQFRLQAPAGYVSGAPAFDFTCLVAIGDVPPVKLCTPNGEQAQGSKVEAQWNTDRASTAPVTVYHTFGSTKTSGTSGKLSFNKDFSIDVTTLGSA